MGEHLTDVAESFRSAHTAAMARSLPTWTRNLDALIEEGAPVRVWCTSCKARQDVDLVALRERVGGSYSLQNRRCRCRLTPGCTGWNQFDYLLGVFS